MGMVAIRRHRTPSPLLVPLIIDHATARQYPVSLSRNRLSVAVV